MAGCSGRPCWMTFLVIVIIFGIMIAGKLMHHLFKKSIKERSEWSEWGSCAVTCGVGMQLRSREQFDWYRDHDHDDDDDHHRRGKWEKMRKAKRRRYYNDRHDDHDEDDDDVHHMAHLDHFSDREDDGGNSFWDKIKGMKDSMKDMMMEAKEMREDISMENVELRQEEIVKEMDDDVYYHTKIYTEQRVCYRGLCPSDEGMNFAAHMLDLMKGK